jgi:O-antigen/teichoic acid export membrane protein
MSVLRRNIVANFAGKGLQAGMALFFPPLYLRLLGAESYGVIGFFGTLAAVLSLLDLGLAMTLNREMARLSAEGTPEADQEMRDLVRTHEVVFWAVGAVAGLAVFALAPVIAHRWLNVRALPVATVTQAVRVMGLIFVLQWPGGLYNGGLLGLQRQVTANALQVTTTTARLLGAAIILWGVSRTVQAFLLWQAVTTSLQTLLAGVALARHLPGAGRGRVRWDVLRQHWRFSAGISGISVLSILLTQVDKIVVGKLFSLAELGYYTLAGTVGNALYYLIGPVFAAVFPRLCQLVTTKDEAGLRRLYHESCQLMSVIVLPAALVLVLFARPLILAWTNNPETVEHTWRIAVAIGIGTSMSGLMNLPYALQLAHGWTQLTLWVNAVAVALLVPLVTLLGRRYGVVGAAAGWAILNAGYVLLSLRLMHRRLLPGEMWRWYLVDVGLPLLGALAVTLPVRVWLHVPAGRVGTLLTLGGVGAVAMVAAALAAPAVRARALATLSRRAAGA